jgi:3-dehydroquinate synthase
MLSGEDRRVFVLTDENVHRLYAAQMPSDRIIVIPAGEDSKTFETIDSIVEQLLALGCDRQSFILGFGGGVVCDITGFVASIYMRGIDFGFVCTTLLSQADAGIGGKNGINHGSLKNMIGTINQPTCIMIDPHHLQTLSPEDYYSGLAEVIKHALISDPDLLLFIETHLDRIQGRCEQSLAHLVNQSVQIKSRIVQADPYEQNLRKILNFGHSFGHALEMQYRLPHGFAVAEGMRIAAWISHQEGLLDLAAVKRIEGLLADLAYPIYPKLEESLLRQALAKDKKSDANRISFVLLEDLGKALYKAMTLDELIGYYYDLP